MFLVLRPRSEGGYLTNRDPEGECYDCFAVSDAVTAHKYLKLEGWKVYSMGALWRVENIEITTKVEVEC